MFVVQRFLRALALGLPVAVLSAIGAQAQTPVLSGIAHIAFRVADLPAATAFYEKLGFEEPFVRGDLAAPTQAFIKINDRQFIELYPRSQDSQPVGMMHFCFESNDLEALHRQYVARGLQPTEVRKAAAGNLLFTLRGPQDENIEYTQYLPGSKHYEDRGKHLGADRISTKLLGGSLIVKEPEAAEQFYTGKLAFRESGGTKPLRLMLPGDSGQAIELEVAEASPHASIVFVVDDLRKAAAELRKRGLDAKMVHASVTVTGPDGTVVVFKAN
jgi:catechol 2,3-dioxygenase-like lactoylglutathione lyase family enzyme